MNIEEVYSKLKINDTAFEDAQRKHLRVNKEIKEEFVKTCEVKEGDVWANEKGVECCIESVKYEYGYFRVTYTHRNHYNGELSGGYATEVSCVLRDWKKIGTWSGRWNGNKVEYIK